MMCGSFQFSLVKYADIFHVEHLTEWVDWKRTQIDMLQGELTYGTLTGMPMKEVREVERDHRN